MPWKRISFFNDNKKPLHFLSALSLLNKRRVTSGHFKLLSALLEPMSQVINAVNILHTEHRPGDCPSPPEHLEIKNK